MDKIGNSTNGIVEWRMENKQRRITFSTQNEMYVFFVLDMKLI